MTVCSGVSTQSSVGQHVGTYHSHGRGLGHGAGDGVGDGVGLRHGRGGRDGRGVGHRFGAVDGAVHSHGGRFAPLVPFVVPRGDSSGRGEADQREDVEQLHGSNWLM